MLEHAVRALAAARSVALVVVVAPPTDVAQVRGLLDNVQVSADLRVIAGGTTRQESVRAGLHALPDDVDVVLVHDAARPLVPVELVEAVVAAVNSGSTAVVPALPVTDTVKRVDLDEVVVQTVDRGELRAVQTPQGFARRVLEAAYEAAGALESTDDAGLVERYGVPVQVIPGAEEAFKVTRPLDLVLAEALLAQRLAHRRARI